MLCSSATEGKIAGWIFLIKRSDAANLDALNLLLLFGDSKQFGSKMFLSTVIAEPVAYIYVLDWGLKEDVA